MNFFFDYIYYRMTKAYYKWDGEEGVTAIIGISGFQLLVLADVSIVIIKLLGFERTETAPYAKMMAYIGVGILFGLIIFNRFKYHKKYNQFQDYWQNEPKNQRVVKGILVILSLILPWIPLILVGVYW